MPTRLAGYDPDSGNVLWSCEGIRGVRGDLVYSSPHICKDVCVAIGGYRGPSIGVKLGGAGDVTKTHQLWRIKSNPQSIGSGVLDPPIRTIPSLPSTSVRMS